MSRNFTMVSPELWTSERFLCLSDAGKLLHLYYLTSTHQNGAGCFRLPDEYACADLRWEATSYVATRKTLLDAKLIQFDPATNEILVERWFRHSPPTNPKHYRGIVCFIERIKSEKLRDTSLEGLPTDFGPARISQLRQANSNGLVATDKPYDLTKTRLMKSVDR